MKVSETVSLERCAPEATTASIDEINVCGKLINQRRVCALFPVSQYCSKSKRTNEAKKDEGSMTAFINGE